MDTEQLLERLAAAEADSTPDRAPARLKARLYSALVTRQSETGRLLSLAATKADGAGLCVFEHTLAPFGEPLGSLNVCRVCHARVLAERLDHAPIFWPNCPYSAFHRSKA